MIPSRIHSEVRSRSAPARVIEATPGTVADQAPRAYNYDAMDRPQFIVAIQALQRLNAFMRIYRIEKEDLQAYMKKRRAVVLDPDQLIVFLDKLGFTISLAEVGRD